MEIFIQSYRIAYFIFKHKKEDCNFLLLSVSCYIIFVFFIVG